MSDDIGVIIVNTVHSKNKDGQALNTSYDGEKCKNLGEICSLHIVKTSNFLVVEIRGHPSKHLGGYVSLFQVNPQFMSLSK